MAIAVSGYFFGDKAAQGGDHRAGGGLDGPTGPRRSRRCWWPRAIRLGAARDDRGERGLPGRRDHRVRELKGSLDELWGIDTRARRAIPRSAIGIVLQTRLLAFAWCWCSPSCC